MHNNLLQILVLLFVVMLLVILAKRIKIAYPIFLVIAGLLITLIPGTPILSLDPDLIFLIFLPPLLYEAAWFTSWNNFWKWKLPIGLLAFGLVFFTSTVIAYASESLIPGFTLALGFLLGGIVSPPDAVAAATVMKGLKVPKRIMTILEGESLINDASSLIVFKFALAAVLTGTFSMQNAIGTFFIVAGMGVVIGVAGAYLMYAIHRFLPTTSAMDAALTVMTPYILFLIAEHFHYSGIMAVVSGGLFMSYRSHKIFKGHNRINMNGVWNTMIFVMNALVFVLIGLELTEIVNNLGNYSIAEAIKYGLNISIITIILRFIWVYPAAYIPRWISSKARNNPAPGWKVLLIMALAGMRGVVSLATALSIPFLMNDKLTAFPERNLIIFITFVVIFVTLVFQGLLIPVILKIIKIDEVDDIIPENDQHLKIQLRLDQLGLQILREKYSIELKTHDLLKLYQSNLEKGITNLKTSLESLSHKEQTENSRKILHSILLETYNAQRLELFRIRKEKLYSDEEIRKMETQIDANELRITGAEH